MSASNWVQIFGIIVAAIVALIIAYMARKQMRQIEVHRADPSIPLIPPPHTITRLLKSYGLLLFTGAYGVSLLVWDLRKTGPVTRADVVWLIVDVALILFSFFAALGKMIFDTGWKVLATFVDRMRPRPSPPDSKPTVSR